MSEPTGPVEPPNPAGSGAAGPDIEDPVSATPNAVPLPDHPLAMASRPDRRFRWATAVIAVEVVVMVLLGVGSTGVWRAYWLAIAAIGAVLLAMFWRRAAGESTA